MVHSPFYSLEFSRMVNGANFLTFHFITMNPHVERYELHLLQEQPAFLSKDTVFSSGIFKKLPSALCLCYLAMLLSVSTQLSFMRTYSVACVFCSTVCIGLHRFTHRKQSMCVILPYLKNAIIQKRFLLGDEHRDQKMAGDDTI